MSHSKEEDSDQEDLKGAEDNPTISISRSAVKELLAQEHAKLAKSHQDDVGVAKAAPPPPPVQKKILKISCYTCGQKLDVTELPSFSRFACPECSASIIVPKWFDNYLLEEPGGVGGMATVYRALDLALDREVAIKILNPDVASQAERAKLFLHEGRTAATVNNPYVIPIYTCGEFEEQPYLVMQYMGGGSLDKIIDNNLPLPMEKAVMWLRNTADGLDSARRHGIIHHDVKPANILLDNDDNAKIGDFGISQAINDTRSKEIDDLTKAWLSPLYVSPEKVINGKEDYMGDIYSLGATFYHLITRKPPFDSTNVNVLIKDRLLKDPVDPRSVNPEIPPAISKLLMRMMSRDPDERPRYNEIRQVAEEFLKSASQAKKRKTQHQSAGAGSVGSPAAQAIASASPAMSMAKSISKEQRPIPDEDVALEVSPSWKGHILSIALHTAIWVVLIAVGVFVLKDRLVKHSGKDALNDLLPYATAAFKGGNPRDAVDVAKQALDSAEVEKIEVKKQAGVQLGFGYYLLDDEDAKQKCEVIAKQLEAAGVKRSDPAVEVLRFLANDDYSSDYLRKLMAQEEPGHQAMASLAVYLRSLYNKLPSSEWTGDWTEYLNSKTAEGHWIIAWRKRASELWYRWIMMGQGNVTDLEPLVAKSKAKSLPAPASGSTPAGKTPPVARAAAGKGKVVQAVEGMTAATLESKRAFAKTRPRPDSFAFNKDDFVTYLAGIPDAAKEAEKDRFECVSQLRSHLVKLFKANPQYQFEGGKIALRSGEALQVSSIMPSQDQVTFNLQGGGRKKVQWSEISLNQVIQFFESFAEKRSHINEVAPDAANDYLAVAVFCDWYGKYEDSVKYAKKAVAVDAGVAQKVDRFFLQ